MNGTMVPVLRASSLLSMAGFSIFQEELGLIERAFERMRLRNGRYFETVNFFGLHPLCLKGSTIY
jgi:hypothetical protein